MTKKRSLFSLIVAACLSVMMSCATTTLDSVWKDPNYQGELNNVLVIGIARRENTRRLFEDRFVTQLKKNGKNAIASYTIIPSLEKINKATVETKIETLAVNAVVVTKVVNVREKRSYASAGPYSGRPYNEGWYGGYSRGSRDTYSPKPLYKYEVVGLEINIYDPQTDKLIWSAWSDTIVDVSVQASIESLIKAIIEKLSENDLL
jgi:hypothetical protein